MTKIYKAVLIILLSGISSQYAPGVMNSVIKVRQVPGRTNYAVPLNLERFDGFVAVNDCSELGNEYYIKPEHYNQWELFLVVDCSGHTETSQWMTRNNIIAEVDYDTAVRWDTLGRGIKVQLAKLVYVKFAPE